MNDQDPSGRPEIRKERARAPITGPGGSLDCASNSLTAEDDARTAGLPTSEAAVDTFESVPIGAYLKRQRALRGVTIDELCAQTRIPLRALQRLEGGEFDGETDGFVRGFVRTVASALGLDVDDTISRMLQEPTLGVWERHSSGRRVKQGVVLFGLVVASGIGFLVFQAGWGLLVGASSDDPDRALVLWRDPVRALAEASGEEMDPAGEIDPARGSRVAPAETLSVSVPRP